MTSRSGAYVFAMGTTPAHAMDARKALALVAPDAELLAREEEQWHYGSGNEELGWGFRFVSSSRADEIEGRLIDTQTGWERRVREQAVGSPVVRRFVEPLSVLVVALGLFGGGVAAGGGQEAGKDLYRATERRIRRRFARRRVSDANDFNASGLAHLFVELGLLYESETAGGLVFLRVLQPRVTFVVEPDLPDEATKQAASIVLGGARRIPRDRPLRFDRRRRRWRAMPDDWFAEETLRSLSSEFADRASNPAPHRSDQRSR